MFSSYGTGQQPPPVHQESGFKGLKTTLQQSSPFQENLLASGGELDLCIKFWNTQTGLCLSEVELARRCVVFCGTVMSVNCLVVMVLARMSLSFGSTVNGEDDRAHWPYLQSSLHDSGLIWTLNCTLANSILFTPDGCTVATAAADETVQAWNVFGIPGVSEPV
ncbi:hypothetical protein L3X38_038481 [Prunus dulcis]|uniref:Transducin/WD40 repeat-like superfamily protein n=1 Tax=Prunus dulcis TaxID=3755 RepID=A0AAD4YS79_PRUDU|nr:hypothetical protein L3X38_038481 [Prunus dulcis]